MEQLKIIKIGGNVINDKTTLKLFLQDFAALQGKKILVHGGGKKASQVLKSMGIDPKMIDGRRITDEQTLEVVTMVYAGLINKNVVAQLQALNCNAIGLTGADINAIRAHKRIVKTIDYGFAGDIDEVNDKGIATLLESGISPVFCAITHDKNGQLLNTNADTIASTLAIALSKHYEVQLKLCFEKQGILLDVNDEESVITELNHRTYLDYKLQGIIYEGMIPKVDNAYHALKNGVQEVHICGVKALRVGAFSGTRLI